MLLKTSAYVGQAFSLRRVFNPPADSPSYPSAGRLKIGRRLKACPTKEILPWM
jgi:hypothetical protein